MTFTKEQVKNMKSSEIEAYEIESFILNKKVVEVKENAASGRISIIFEGAEDIVILHVGPEGGGYDDITCSVDILDK